ncbi:MAG: signal peptide peptidase SppA [Spirochaetae bacterium HGW-Spirochaetae-1]|jgi:protease-4|nr:MAG: signal peptide peptidase SppA [Spirochaetae bacterium HGW-Spirochaetae-1]
MDRNRKILISILALLVLSSVIAIVDISLRIQKTQDTQFALATPKFGPGIGLVRIEGPIEMSSGTSALGLKSGAEAIIQRLDDLEKNSSIKAVVIRINSPGGTVAASQEIYQKIWRLRKKNIPLVVSMADVAASGGYYVASACNYIMANYGTITGSIGVIAYSPNLKRLFEKLGIQMNVIKSGRFKDILSTHRDLAPEERIMIQEMIDASYRKFLKDIALGRNINISDIEPIADGRVMNGEAALKYKLIDGLGDFEDAVNKARELAGLSEDAPVYDDITHPFQQLLMNMEGMFRGQTILKEGMDYNNLYKFEYRYLP